MMSRGYRYKLVSTGANCALRKSPVVFSRASALLFLAAPRHQTVFEKFADFRFKRIVVVDEEARCKGIISVSDLLAYFL